MRVVLPLLLLALCSSTHALKFLLYNPKTSKSHVNFMNKISDLLVEAGHDVVHMMPAQDLAFDNDRSAITKRARVIERACDFDNKTQDFKISHFQVDAWKHDASVAASYKMFSALGGLFNVACDHLLADKALLERLEAEKFDLGLSEWFDACGFALFEKIKVHKWISVFSSLLHPVFARELGLGSTVGYVPSFHALEDLSSFKSRLINQFEYWSAIATIDWSFVQLTASSFPKHGIHENVNSLIARGSYYMVNVDELVDFPRPITSKVIAIAGLGVKPKKRVELDSALRSFVDRAPRGIVFMSFGSVAHSQHMPIEMKNAFFAAIKHFSDVHFIWKYENPDDPIVKGINNLYASAWLPQQAIFDESKLLAFVSHGGMNSVTEATAGGIPILTIPLFADQFRNAMMMKVKKLGLMLDKFEITKENLIEALSTLINDKRYMDNAKEMATMIKNKPESANQRVVRYSEFAARYDVHPHLDMPSRQLNYVQFYNIDVFVFIGLITLALFYAIYAAVRYFMQRRGAASSATTLKKRKQQ